MAEDKEAQTKEPQIFDANERARLTRALAKGGTIWHEGKSITTTEQLKRLFQTPAEMDAEIEELTSRKQAASEKKSPAKK